MYVFGHQNQWRVKVMWRHPKPRHILHILGLVKLLMKLWHCNDIPAKSIRLIRVLISCFSVAKDKKMRTSAIAATPMGILVAWDSKVRIILIIDLPGTQHTL